MSVSTTTAVGEVTAGTLSIGVSGVIGSTGDSTGVVVGPAGSLRIVRIVNSDLDKNKRCKLTIQAAVPGEKQRQ